MGGDVREVEREGGHCHGYCDSRFPSFIGSTCSQAEPVASRAS